MPQATKTTSNKRKRESLEETTDTIDEEEEVQKKTKTATMNVYIALLRGINMMGKNVIKMAELKTMFEDAGLLNVKTYIQSGNVVFLSDNDSVTLQNLIQSKIETVFGLNIPVIIRTVSQMEDIIRNCPYTEDSKKKNPYITLLSAIPDGTDGIEKLSTHAQITTEEYSIVSCEVYIMYKDMRKSRITNNMIEKRLAVSATTRNWNTMTKLLNIAKAI
jgi:uncharacterized protein (DUF1697 family)